MVLQHVSGFDGQQTTPRGPPVGPLRFPLQKSQYANDRSGLDKARHPRPDLPISFGQDQPIGNRYPDKREGLAMMTTRANPCTRGESVNALWPFGETGSSGVSVNQV
jgi:hypothetical protein